MKYDEIRALKDAVVLLEKGFQKGNKKTFRGKSGSQNP